MTRWWQNTFSFPSPPPSSSLAATHISMSISETLREMSKSNDDSEHRKKARRVSMAGWRHLESSIIALRNNFVLEKLFNRSKWRRKFDNLANRAELKFWRNCRKRRRRWFFYQPFLYFYRLNGQARMTQTRSKRSSEKKNLLPISAHGFWRRRKIWILCECVCASENCAKTWVRNWPNNNNNDHDIGSIRNIFSRQERVMWWWVNKQKGQKKKKKILLMLH